MKTGHEGPQEVVKEAQPLPESVHGAPTSHGPDTSRFDTLERKLDHVIELLGHQGHKLRDVESRLDTVETSVVNVETLSEQIIEFIQVQPKPAVTLKLVLGVPEPQ